MLDLYADYKIYLFHQLLNLQELHMICKFVYYFLSQGRLENRTLTLSNVPGFRIRLLSISETFRPTAESKGLEPWPACANHRLSKPVPDLRVTLQLPPHCGERRNRTPTLSDTPVFKAGRRPCSSALHATLRPSPCSSPRGRPGGSLPSCPVSGGF